LSDYGDYEEKYRSEENRFSEVQIAQENSKLNLRAQGNQEILARMAS